MVEDCSARWAKEEGEGKHVISHGLQYCQINETINKRNLIRLFLGTNKLVVSLLIYAFLVLIFVIVYVCTLDLSAQMLSFQTKVLTQLGLTMTFL